jgi:hypothetical protein
MTILTALLAAAFIAFTAGHWRGWGAGYETGRRRGYMQGAEDQEYADCRDAEDMQAIMRRVTEAELN